MGDSTTGRGRRGLPPPNLCGAVFLFLSVALPLGFSHRLLNSDGDVARHLVLGRHVLEYGVTFADPFSHTRAGERFVAYEWMSEVLFAAAESIAGLPGVVALASLLIATAVLMVSAFLRSRLEPLFSTPAVFAIAILTTVHWIARPHLFSFLCLSLLLTLVTSRRRGTTYLGLLVLFGFWANLHPGFLYGLAMLSAFLLGAVLDRTWEAREAIIAGGAAAVGTMLNPLGWELHVSILHHLQDQRAFEMVQEFEPLNVASPFGIAVLVILGIGTALFVKAGRSMSFAALLPFLASAAAAITAQRNGTLVGLFAFPLALTAGADGLHAWSRPRLAALRARLREDESRGVSAPWIGAGVAAIIVVTATGALFPNLHRSSSRFSPDVFPVDAVAAARGVGYDDLRMFNAYSWGGYILHAWPEQRIFIDGMANFFGSDLMEEYVAILTAEPGWEAKLLRRGVDLIIVPTDVPLAATAAESGDWRVVHEDHVSRLLVRVPALGTDGPGASHQ